MKAKEKTIKDKIITYGLDLAKQMIISFIKAKLLPDKQKKVEKKNKVIVVKEVKLEKLKKPLKVKKNRKLLRKALFMFLLKEVVLDRVIAKVSLKPSSKELFLLPGLPLRKQFVDLNDVSEVLSTDSKVLDLGSGSGNFAIETAKYLQSPGKIYCIDVNLEALEKLAGIAIGENLSNIEFHRTNIENLPFENDFYDVAYMNMTMGQLPDKIKALSETYRVLKKDGFLVITELLVDPYYCLRPNILSLAAAANFKLISEKGNFLKYTIIFKKE